MNFIFLTINFCFELYVSRKIFVTIYIQILKYKFFNIIKKIFKKIWTVFNKKDNKYNIMVNLFSDFHFETNYEKIFFFFIMLIIWTTYFLIVNVSVKPEKIWLNLSKKHADDIRNRVVSITHGLFTFLVTTYHIFQHKPQYNEPITQFQHFLILMSASYFTYNLIACIYYHLTDAALYIHHLLVILGYFMDEYSGYGGTETLSFYLA